MGKRYGVHCVARCSLSAIILFKQAWNLSTWRPKGMVHGGLQHNLHQAQQHLKRNVPASALHGLRRENSGKDKKLSSRRHVSVSLLNAAMIRHLGMAGGTIAALDCGCIEATAQTPELFDPERARKKANDQLAKANVAFANANVESSLVNVCRAAEAVAATRNSVIAGGVKAQTVRSVARYLLFKAELEDDMVRAAYIANIDGAFESRVLAVEALESLTEKVQPGELVGSRQQRVAEGLQLALEQLLSFLSKFPPDLVRRLEEQVEQENANSAADYKPAFPWRGRN